MSKYEIGQEVPVGGIITITGATQNKQGTWIYSTDRKASVPEYFIESLEMKPLEKAQPEQPKQEPVKLYCFKSYHKMATAGKIYTVPENGNLVFDNGQVSAYDWTTKIPAMWPECFCKLVNRTAKVGEWVYITRTTDSRLNRGEIYQIDSIDPIGSTSTYIKHSKGTNCGRINITGDIFKTEYLVLDGYKPEPEYYNGKVICVANNASRWFTTGKVYEVRNGVLNDDDGKFDYNPITPAKTLEQLNVEQIPKFIEFKGE